MAFYREFLEQRGEIFDERDEAALVHFLLEARLRGSAAGVEIGPDFAAPVDALGPLTSREGKMHLEFVWGFLCFFVAKPMGYARDMRAFKRYFIPGFAGNPAKQIQLGQALKPEFFTARFADLENAGSLGVLMDTDVMQERKRELAMV